MLALYVVTNNAFGAEGRHFYPFVFAGLLSVVWYAPRTLGRQARKMQIAMATLAIAYSIAASIFALKDVVYRYYGPADGTFVAARWSPSLVSTGMPTGILRPVKSTAYQVDNLDMPDTFRKTSKPLSVSGTAAFPEKGLPAQSIAVVLDGRRSLPVLPRQYDVTIAEGSRNKRYAYSSFFAYVPTASLDEGVHVVRAFARALGSPTYQMLSPTRLFFLTQGKGEFSSGFVSKLNGISRLNVRATFEGVCRGTSYTGSGGRAASIGSVLLVKTRVPSARDGTDAAWLLAGRRPYPMKALGDESRSAGDTTPAGERVYTGTVPTQGLSPGTLVVRSFLFDPAMGRYLEAGPPLRLTLFDRVANGDPTVSRPIPSACVDPLRALQGSIP